MDTDTGEHGMRRSLLCGTCGRCFVPQAGCRCRNTTAMVSGEQGCGKGGQHGPRGVMRRAGGILKHALSVALTPGLNKAMAYTAGSGPARAKRVGDRAARAV